MKTQKVIPIIFDTYIAVIKNSVGSKMFRNFYAKVNGKKTDIMNNGDVSCAWFVSSILCLFKLVKDIHCTVDGTVRDLEQSDWKKISLKNYIPGKQPEPGSVIIWEKMDFGKNDFHKHIGFYIGNNKVISTSSAKNGQPTIHRWTYRKIEAIFWNKKLDK